MGTFLSITTMAVIYGVIATGLSLGIILAYPTVLYVFSHKGTHEPPKVTKRALRWSCVTGLTVLAVAVTLQMMVLMSTGGSVIVDGITLDMGNPPMSEPPQAP